MLVDHKVIQDVYDVVHSAKMTEEVLRTVFPHYYNQNAFTKTDEMMRNLTNIKPNMKFRALIGGEGGEVRARKKKDGPFWSERLIKQFQFKYY